MGDFYFAVKISIDFIYFRDQIVEVKNDVKCCFTVFDKIVVKSKVELILRKVAILIKG